MSDNYGTTSTPADPSRDLGTVDVSPASGTGSHDTGSYRTDAYGTDTHGTDSAIASGTTTDVAKEEAKATGQQAKEGARHVAEVGKDEAKNVAQETGQQAKELWEQTRSQLLEQSAQQQTRLAEGLRSLSQELSGMARQSEQQGVASDLAHQASQRIGDVAGWLDQRDPGSLVTELKQFARQRPGAFLATAAVIGLVGGRLSRGLVADHQDQSADDHRAASPGYDASTGYSTSTGYGASTGNGGGAVSGAYGGSPTSGVSATADPEAYPA
ncbi:vacuolar-type H+-ATPase subunit H [Phycicoccus badiiscoriae]|uniref:Vacuolar-type H+-ATPase subunit H n=1 Tax=Pedococcus badiiscoriae TaxID=642776 RepID=A0A852W9V5_9MICO|nr:hypothetical protein [Pedococcus badiiscoriae]NYG05813.1 vacuolar-type H+-ATPase subunit H [Pedococcus badiiscoriae]